MVFHPGKCTTLPVTCKKKPRSNSYHLHNQELATVASAKYLGVTITNDLSWDEHINSICSKANKTLGFLRRNLRVGATQLKETAYKSLVTYGPYWSTPPQSGTPTPNRASRSWKPSSEERPGLSSTGTTIPQV